MAKEISLHQQQSHHQTNRAPLCPTDQDAIVPRARQRLASPNRPADLDKRSTEYLVKSGIAGGLAGCAAKTVVAPLDRVKILFQANNPRFQKYTGSWSGVAVAMRDIYAQSGHRGLYRGHSATLLRIFPYAGIKFLAYEQVRAFLIPDKAHETSLRRLTAGSIAGSISVFFTYPLEVIRVRLAYDTTRQSRSSLAAICKQIYHEQPPAMARPPHIDTTTVARTATTALDATTAAMAQAVPHSGLANFYRGFTPTLWGMLPYAGTSFLTHDLMGDFLRRPDIAQYTTLPKKQSRSDNPDKPAPLTTWAQFAAGGMAGFVSQTVSYPLEIIRRRMQVSGAVGDGRRLRMAEVAAKIWMESGWRGFFVGLGIGYFKVVPMTATAFFVYERSKFHMGI